MELYAQQAAVRCLCLKAFAGKGSGGLTVAVDDTGQAAIGGGNHAGAVVAALQLLPAVVLLHAAQRKTGTAEAEASQGAAACCSIANKQTGSAHCLLTRVTSRR